MYFSNTVSLTRNPYFLPVLPTLTKGPASLFTTETSSGVFPASCTVRLETLAFG